ncbi:hypothetical protein BDP55DRAFT_242365 [Colletotrichum godetiae]|uniref:Uncharacterized protein n=1 Tax=Colletotrichum godetiae TaxID=1209918 RepID=A0AAJ0AJ42_9PEZI|nr:uncharacterized protein BDP55DRAFT_242365 [Colletotrichum godetiae]KAK1672646.1 hypothetical protein BDP55DRAFT_242365 [Colletotrichum godetiae]
MLTRAGPPLSKDTHSSSYLYGYTTLTTLPKVMSGCTWSGQHAGNPDRLGNPNTWVSPSPRSISCFLRCSVPLECQSSSRITHRQTEGRREEAGIGCWQLLSRTRPKNTRQQQLLLSPGLAFTALLPRPIEPNVPFMGSFCHFWVLRSNATIQPKIDRTTHHRPYRHIRFEQVLSCPLSLASDLSTTPCVLSHPFPHPPLTVPSARSPDSRTGGEGQEEQAQL